MIKIVEIENLREIYDCQMGFQSPYFFSVPFAAWEESFARDVDGEGRILFKDMVVKAAYEADKLVGFIQYGHSAFGFNEQGDISDAVSYPIIRNLYFDATCVDAGEALLKEALEVLGNTQRVYAFFHYFGMSCFARHGKLFEQHPHIEALLKEHGFETEHENVYYSSMLNGEENAEIEVVSYDLTKGNQLYIDFKLSGNQVGGCEIHFVDEKIAYLRWIYVNGEITGKGIGTKCMYALKQWLYRKGITRFDTDTAMSNLVAQHYYEKTGCTREGITRSYYLG
jgi:RimJ/RimL family protein N-acetyltransferase